jgi:hypothetical protein
MQYFSEDGRRIPHAGMRVFSQNKSDYYKFSRQEISYEEIYLNFKKYGDGEIKISCSEFTERAKSLYGKIKNNKDYENITNGYAIPFIMPSIKNTLNLGRLLQMKYLPSLKNSFESNFTNNKFKAILQGGTELDGNVQMEPESNVEKLFEQCLNNEIVCWLFPEVFSGYDIFSQRKQISTLPKAQDFGVCLGGGVDILSAAIGTPSLLINENHYAPIICMSGYTNLDPRLVMLLKSYGPHLEFWCMSQMLTSQITQVSEQWTGALTLFEIQ